MPWNARLDLRYGLSADRVVARHVHEGPLRVLKSLYPEGPGVCHSVLVHPPGGIAGGDRLDIGIDVEQGAHALISTPGATRFYRSEGAAGVQDVRVRLARGARLEWVPLETLVFPGAQAENRLTLQLAPGAAMIGWDVLGLGLPHSGQAFASGSVLQRIAWPGVWLEHARIDASDEHLLDGPLGLAGQRCLATMFYARGDALTRAQREAALELTREVVHADPVAARAGATLLDDRLLVVRALAPVTEPASALLRKIWAAWRSHFWSAPIAPPRIWRV